MLLVLPYRQLKEEFFDNEKYFFLEENGISFYNNHSKKREILIDDGEVYYTLNNLRDELNWWIPIFERWIGKSFLFEEYRIKVLSAINYLKNVESKFNIKKIIHFTAIPHHIISFTVNIFGIKSNINQVFFYSCIFDGRLIPVLQDSTGKRVIINHKLSIINYDKPISSFIKNKFDGNNPKINTPITKGKKSLFYVYLLLSLKFIKNNILRLKNDNRLKKGIFFFNENEFSISNYFEIVNRQNDFLKYYKRYSINETTFKKEIINKGKVLVIAAHYQPEATSFPEGSSYMNHIDIMIVLRNIGFEEKIFYKEHQASDLYIDPPSIFITKVSNYKNLYYLNFMKKHNVCFINQGVPLNINDEYSEMYLPITITGTIAIERSLVGLKTIICGEPIYKGLPGTIHIDTIKDKDFLKNINLKKEKKIANDAKIFLKELFDNNTIQNPFGIASGLKNEKNIDKFLQFIKQC